jgi:hypothetical protein
MTHYLLPVFRRTAGLDDSADFLFSMYARSAKFISRW